MTASEPLPLEEEYDMQLSWKEDPKKCTFIVLALSGDGGGEGQEKDAGESAVMAGDVNLFFNDYEDPGVCEVCVDESAWVNSNVVRSLIQRGRRRARSALMDISRYRSCS